jgi:hypothetical protein
MTRLSNDTDQVSIFTLLNKDLSADDAIAVRTVGGVYDTEGEHLLLGKFASQPKEHVVSDNFPYAAIELNEMWDIKTQYLTKFGTDTATAPQTTVSRSSLVEEVRLLKCDQTTTPSGQCNPRGPAS